ncbi:MAG: hypothetical protein KC636_35350, partial [Myxococcales bacterium]|nr:hypothetical protein [Myxococcales bacterium]
MIALRRRAEDHAPVVADADDFTRPIRQLRDDRAAGLVEQRERRLVRDPQADLGEVGEPRARGQGQRPLRDRDPPALTPGLRIEEQRRPLDLDEHPAAALARPQRPLDPRDLLRKPDRPAQAVEHRELIVAASEAVEPLAVHAVLLARAVGARDHARAPDRAAVARPQVQGTVEARAMASVEGRRVGQEGRSRWAP